MASSASPNVSRIKRFDGTNYLAWRNRVYTELLCEDLADFIDKKPTDELKKKEYGPKKHPISWSQADARARRIVVDNLADSLLHYAPVDASSTYEVWRKLKVTYNRTSYLQHAYLRRKLSNLQYDGKSDLPSFFRDFDDIIAEIRASGGKVGKLEDIEAVVILLAALPSDYSPLIASFGEINENALVTLETVKGALLDYDLKRKDEQKIKKPDVLEKDTAYMSDTAHESACLSDSRSSNKFKDARFDNRTEKLHCSYCGRDGHRENRCFKKRNDKRAQTDAKGGGEANLAGGDGVAARSVAFLTENPRASHSLLTNVIQVELVFVADSGCTKFMINNRRHFSSSKLLTEPVPITLADNRSTHATYIGTVDLVSNLGNRVTFNDVLFVPELRRNLLSVRRIALRDYDVTFKRSSVLITRDNEVLASGFVRDDLYFMNFSVFSKSGELCEANLSYEQLHRRLGHPNKQVVSDLKKDGLVDFQGTVPSTCEPCIQGKLSQLP